MRVTLRRLFAAALFAATPIVANAAPVPATPAKNEKPMANARKALDEVTDMNYQGRTLNDVIADLKEKAKVPVILDSVVYQFGLDPNQPVVNVNLKQVKMRDGLKAVLAPYNLKFGLTADGLFISTEEGVVTRQLRQRVSLDCDGTTFAAAAKQLAADTGANVVVDPRLGPKANAAVTLKLDDVPLETAIRLLSEIADLRTVRMSNVLFVTTADRVKEKGLHDDGHTSPSPLNPIFPNGGGIAFPAIGGFGVVGGAPGVVVPAPGADPLPVVEEKPVEEKPAEKKGEKPAEKPVEKSGAGEKPAEKPPVVPPPAPAGGTAPPPEKKP